ncbi:MAG TPA: nuclear transport factor 2 family protein [Gemmatimonadota bacterium]|nr:nuclear transport factor 2 family protein [Gemmatimonadota bacterium]
MVVRFRNRPPSRPAIALAGALIGGLMIAAACAPGDESPAPADEAPGPADLTDFANRYAAAWSSQDPGRFASFYAEDGTLVVNGAAFEGRDAIRTTAGEFMAAFPDMRVRMDSVVGGDGRTVFHWTWTGTNTGPGGTGRPVDLTGYEEWTFGADGLIAVSDGHYDQAEFERQMAAELP